MSDKPDLLAGSEILGSVSYTHLFAGDTPNVVTDGGELAGEALAQYQVIARGTDGKIYKYDPAGTNGKNKAVGITLLACAAGKNTQYYLGGCFNDQALVWPAAAADLATRKAVFVNTNIVIKRIV